MEKSNSYEKVDCKAHRMLMFFVPLLYALETRFLKRSKYGVVVWATEYLIPILISFYLIHMGFCGWINWLIDILAVYNLYEIGYIQNDCETIKKEISPTLRVSSEELWFYEKWKILCYGFRILLGIITSSYFLSIGTDVRTLFIFWLIVPVYLIYNRIRGRINLYLIFPLTLYRYVVPLVLLNTNSYRESVVLTVVIAAYPFLKWVEVCAGGKSLPQEKWTKMFLNSFDARFRFRIKYYSVLTLACICLCYFHEIVAWLWVLPMYFLLLRSCQLHMPRLGAR